LKANDLKNAVKREFPQLKKWFCESVFCFDTKYYIPDFQEMREINDQAWSEVGKISYRELVSDCDDFALWMNAEVRTIRALSGAKLPYAFGEAVGMTDKGMHAFNIFLADRIYISDYGRIQPTENYKPVWVRF
jgi:hypothetical protein